jgi:DNA repair protein SbcC/Rad50
MILLTLKLQHFKQYEELELHFREGLTGIIGRNGAGKSTIFEAVLVCLFGDIEGDKKMIRSSWAADKDAVVLELSFEIQQKTYRISREFRGKTLTHQATLYDHNELALATGATPVTQQVEQLIGMDREAFTRSIFSGQKELGEISNTKGEERRKMVRKMVGLHKLDHIQNLIREDRNSAKNQIKGKAGLLLEPAALEALQKELTAQQKTAEKEQIQLDKLSQQLHKKQEKYAAARAEFDSQHQLSKTHTLIATELTRFESALETLLQQAAEQDQRIIELKQLDKALRLQAPQISAYEKQQKELIHLEERKAAFDQVQSLLKEQQWLTQQVNERQKQINVFEAIPTRVRNGEAHIDKLATALKTSQLALKKQGDELARWQRALSVIQAKIEERNQQIQQISSLGKEAECPTCFQPLINSYESTLKRFQEELRAYAQTEQAELQQQIAVTEAHCLTFQTEVDFNQAELQKAHNILSGLVEQQKQLQQILDAQQKDSAQIRSIQQQIEQLGRIDFDAEKYSQLKSQIEQFSGSYIHYRNQLHEVSKLQEEEKTKTTLLERIKNGKATIAEKKQALKALHFSEKTYQKAQELQQKTEEERDEIHRLHHQQVAQCYNLSSGIQGLAEQLKYQEGIGQSILLQQQELETLEALEATFTKFKSQVLDRVRPIISNHASALFAQITKGRYESIEVDENFEFYIYDNGASYPITRFSGGEIDLANLCLRIGISKAIAELSGSAAATSLLCFDEIFGSQDEDRRYEILRALDLLKEQYRQIYIVSHIESTKDYFPNILQIQKHREGSGVEWI